MLRQKQMPCMAALKLDVGLTVYTRVMLHGDNQQPMKLAAGNANMWIDLRCWWTWQRLTVRSSWL